MEISVQVINYRIVHRGYQDGSRGSKTVTCRNRSIGRISKIRQRLDFMLILERKSCVNCTFRY